MSDETGKKPESRKPQRVGVDELVRLIVTDCLPDDDLQPVILHCNDLDTGLKMQYICWPPSNEFGWLMVLPPHFESDIEIKDSDDIEIFGWSKI